MGCKTGISVFALVASFILNTTPAQGELLQGFGLASASGGKCLAVVLDLNLLLNLAILDCGSVIVPSQVWETTYTGYFDFESGPAYQIVSSVNGKCLTNINGAVVLQTCEAGVTPKQLWFGEVTIENASTNQWINVDDGKCLKLTNVLLTLIDTLNTATCSDTAPNQQWAFKT